ncbi:MAG: GGDEF domain-containing protein [Anaerolineae bacterium]|nr:GGDEF domain-containing protein [Anaerolineae bacterium]MBT7070480.1 GGDEF domain-containing protein [Anaerolineae bacterium]MBT7326840.1 GGDEF domain-containing protein [Anaerolineae bacterium]
MNAQKNLRRQANTDSLTGLYNRRSFFQRTQQEISRYQRSKRFFSLLMIDIDHFKNVNDTYGHSTGDIVLQSLARTLLKTAREQDIVARTGGEEFSILLPEAKKDKAKIFAERIREIVSESEMGTKEIEIQITISIGVAEICPNEDKDDIYNRADSALYRAKSAGRNRVEVA